MKSSIFWFIPLRARAAGLWAVLGFWLLMISEVHAQVPFVSDISLHDAGDGQVHSVRSLVRNEYAVIIFSSGKCIYDKYYDERVTSLIKSYAGKGVSFIAINSSDSRGEMAQDERARRVYIENKVSYLSDINQEAKKSFGASKTPEVFFVRKSSGGFQVIYQGAIDNNPQVADDVKEHYLENVITETLAGRAPSFSKRNAIGCVIRPK